VQTKHQRLAVVLDEAAARRVEQAAEQAARRVLIDAIAAAYERNERSISELAAETGLAVEEIIEGMAARSGDAGLETFLASSRAVSEARNDPEFLRLSEVAAADVRAREPAPMADDVT